jgi:hypothetical protein
MVREFEVVLGEVNSEEAKFRLDNEYDENGNPIPHREWTTGIDREGNAAKMAVKGRMPTVVHGFERAGSKTPYTLVIFEWSTERLRLDRRFREVTIEVSFTAHGTRREAEPAAQALRAKGVGKTHWDPEVCAIVPEGTSWFHRTTHKVTEKSQWEVSLKAAFGQYFTAGPKYHWERGDVADVTAAIQLSGSRVAVGSGHNRPNAARWVMLENASQRSGVPAFLRTAVLLKRLPKDDGQFLGTVNVSYRVSPFHDFKETLQKLMGRLPNDKPIIFDPHVTTKPPLFPLSGLADVDLSKEFQLISLEPLPANSGKADAEAKEESAKDRPDEEKSTDTSDAA